MGGWWVGYLELNGAFVLGEDCGGFLHKGAEIREVFRGVVGGK